MSRRTPGGFEGLFGDAVWCTTSLRMGAKARPDVRIDSSAPHSARLMMCGAPTPFGVARGATAAAGAVDTFAGSRSSPRERFVGRRGVSRRGPQDA